MIRSRKDESKGGRNKNTRNAFRVKYHCIFERASQKKSRLFLVVLTKIVREALTMEEEKGDQKYKSM
jgi:hypothetical protein